MFLYRFIVCFTFLFFNNSINAQNLIDLLNKNKKGYKIEGEISGLKDTISIRKEKEKDKVPRIAMTKPTYFSSFLNSPLPTSSAQYF